MFLKDKIKQREALINYFNNNNNNYPKYHTSKQQNLNQIETVLNNNHQLNFRQQQINLVNKSKYLIVNYQLYPLLNKSFYFFH